MDDKTTLVNVSKKSMFLWLYVIIIIIILVLIAIFVFLRTSPSPLISVDESTNDFNNPIILDEENTSENIVEMVYDPNPKNCGTNINCFKEYAADCKEGYKFLFTDTINNENKLFTRITEYTLKGIEHANCKVEFSLYDINVEIIGEDNLNESMVSKDDIGTLGVCYFDTPQAFLDYLDLKENGTFNGSVDCFVHEGNNMTCSSRGDMLGNSCEGFYFTLQYE